MEPDPAWLVLERLNPRLERVLNVPASYMHRHRLVEHTNSKPRNVPPSTRLASGNVTHFSAHSSVSITLHHSEKIWQTWECLWSTTHGKIRKYYEGRCHYSFWILTSETLPIHKASCQRHGIPHPLLCWICIAHHYGLDEAVKDRHQNQSRDRSCWLSREGLRLWL